MPTQTPSLEPVATQGQSGQTSGIANALHRFFNNLTGMLEYQRTANVFKTIQAAAANNTVWTPSSGTLKFRLMQFEIELPTNAAISGGGVVVTVSFEDAVGNQIGLAYDFFVPTTAVVTGNGSTVVTVTLPGNGYLSTAAGNVLNAKISTALTTGAFRITARGCEE